MNFGEGMKSEDVLNEFREAGALWEGHFILASGLHLPVYLQKALVFRDPVRTERLARAIAAKAKNSGHGPFDIVVSPAVGGIIPGYEVARALGLPAIYVERDKERFVFNRGFELSPGARVLMVEDIVTTGVSSRECLDAIRKAGGKPVLVSCVIDRSAGRADLGVPFLPLATLDIPTYAEGNLPPELVRIPAVKPGTRQKAMGA
jgi:orotate phosphoribosyltransferase